MTLKLRQTIPLLATAVVLIGLQSAPNAADKTDAKEPADKYLLRYHFEPGETLRYESVMQLMQQGVVGTKSKIDNTLTRQKRVFTIGEVTEDGQADVSMQFEHVRMEIQSNGEEPEVFDSTMPLENVTKKFQGTARQLAGAAPKYQLQAQGTPVSEDGIQQIPDGGQASFMFPLPEQEVAIGESWKVNMVINVRIGEGVKRDITLLRTYTLRSVEDGIATIGFSTSVSSAVKVPAVKAQLLQATPQGEMLFDIAKGRLLRKEMRIDRMVIGALGPGTMLSAKSSTIETLN
jgi:hypothetical protein